LAILSLLKGKTGLYEWEEPARTPQTHLFAGMQLLRMGKCNHPGRKYDFIDRNQQAMLNLPDYHALLEMLNFLVCRRAVNCAG
jgi:hypothetical protein